VRGTGKVSVMLMEASGEEIIYQTDTSAASDSTKIDTVMVTDAQRNQNGLIRKIIAPQYCGAIVVCSGADDPQIRLEIVEAVSRITGLGADRISVLKMK
jgi:stage III sporulation protein AG